MINRFLGRSGARFALVLTILLCSSAAWAAGEWEWTAGQGWVQGAGVARPTPKEQLHYAYELEKRGEYMDSARQYFLLVQNFPNSQEAGVGLQRLARCLFEMENYWTSYKAIEQVIETYPNTGRMSDLVEIELRIAKKLMVSHTPDILSGNEANTRDFNIRRALQIIDSVIEHDPYGPVAAEAYLVKGEGHLFINEVADARKSFETILDEFPRSDFVERARLGTLTCDSLMGQAKPQEVQEQIEVVREAERERANRRQTEMDELDEVEGSIKQLAEVEAAKMMEQASQYRRMGTRKTVQAAEFLYKEVARRYPDTPQADEANEFLGNLKLPKEESKIAKTIKGINLNPFTYNKDPEPPWIVPQLAAGDMVMVDDGLGPISGVAETGQRLPDTSYSPTVRPHNLPEVSVAPEGNFSPASAAPSRAPRFIDGTAAPRTYVSEAGRGPEIASAPLPPGMSGLDGASNRNPLSHASESDLVLAPGQLPPSLGNSRSPYDAPPAYDNGGYGQQPYYDNAPVASSYQAAPSGPPNLGAPIQHTPYSDLIGPPPSSVRQPPLPDYDGVSSYSPPTAQYHDTSSYGSGSYQSSGGYDSGYGNSGYGQDYQQSFSAPTPPRPAPVYSDGTGGGSSGWTLGDDFR